MTTTTDTIRRETTTTMTTTFIPPTAQAVIERFGMTRLPEIHPPREGERAIHTCCATELWAGDNPGDDGNDFMSLAIQMRWRPDPGYGDWPIAVECFRVHDPKDDPPESGRFFIAMRLTYLEGSTYLAFYRSLREARADAANAFPEDM